MYGAASVRKILARSPSKSKCCWKQWRGVVEGWCGDGLHSKGQAVFVDKNDCCCSLDDKHGGSRDATANLGLAWPQEKYNFT